MAITLAAENPEKVSKVVLIDAQVCVVVFCQIIACSSVSFANFPLRDLSMGRDHQIYQIF